MIQGKSTTPGVVAAFEKTMVADYKAGPRYGHWTGIDKLWKAESLGV